MSSFHKASAVCFIAGLCVLTMSAPALAHGAGGGGGGGGMRPGGGPPPVFVDGSEAGRAVSGCSRPVTNTSGKIVYRRVQFCN
jgi:hypothetical protein